MDDDRLTILQSQVETMAANMDRLITVIQRANSTSAYSEVRFIITAGSYTPMELPEAAGGLLLYAPQDGDLTNIVVRVGAIKYTFASGTTKAVLIPVPPPLRKVEFQNTGNGDFPIVAQAVSVDYAKVLSSMIVG